MLEFMRMAGLLRELNMTHNERVKTRISKEWTARMALSPPNDTQFEREYMHLPIRGVYLEPNHIGLGVQGGNAGTGQGARDKFFLSLRTKHDFCNVC